MVRILLLGCNGRMGQAITLAAKERGDLVIAAGVDIHPINLNAYPIYADVANVEEPVDVIIDFSHPSGTEKALRYAVERQLPIVMATTGLEPADLDLLREAAKQTAVLRSANMSLGVNLLMELAQKAAKALYRDWDIEIVEKHHNQKLDAPSGTALAIADAMNEVISDVDMAYVNGRHGKSEKRTRQEIGIHAVRGGTIPGEHTVIFAGRDEVIELQHTALSRSIFAEGALSAALFLAGKTPGLYSMRDLFA